mmetsp:Transcript_55823/g.124686  ORF Transcript_55823/g.124686 Transcript_55823/m.124686 type:complete len:165 (+) Transcript_55823:33-527(+)
MDWPLSSAEKRGLAFELYHREVTAAEVSLQAAERELRQLRHEQAKPLRWSLSSESESQEVVCRPQRQSPASPQAPQPQPTLTPRRRRWSRRSSQHDGAMTSRGSPEPPRPDRDCTRWAREMPETRARAISWDAAGSQRRERHVPLASLESFLGQDVPSNPFSFT